MRNQPMHPSSARRRIAARCVVAGMLLPLAACAGSGSFAPGVGGEVTVDSLMRVADSTRDQGEYATAAGMYGRAHELAPGEIAPLMALADTLRRMRAPGAAADAYRRALALEPRNFDALRGLGAVLVELDRPEHAIAQLELALDVAKDHRVYNALGVAHDMLGDQAAAQVYYREGLELAPENLRIANNYGLSLALSGDTGAAIAMLERAVENPHATPRLRQNLALVYGLAGEQDAARRMAGVDLDEAAVAHNLSYYDLLRHTGDSSMTASALGTHKADDGT